MTTSPAGDTVTLRAPPSSRTVMGTSQAQKPLRTAAATEKIADNTKKTNDLLRKGAGGLTFT